MTRPRLLDLFCGAGGCSVGYARAGFDVTGVDIEDHPDYPFELIVADAMDVLADRDYLAGFDVVHASPPCQFFSTMTGDPTRHLDLLTPTIAALKRQCIRFVVENVEGARRAMDHPLKLCGSSFGLAVRRHRYFECSEFMWALPCNHDAQGIPIGVYGSHPEHCETPKRPNGGTSRGVRARTLSDASTAMGIGWMSRWDDLREAIPPAFTEFIGRQLLEQLRAAA